MRGSEGADPIPPYLIVGLNMENENLNKSFCEDLFGGELDVVEMPDSIDCEKSQARQHRNWLHRLTEAG